MPKETRLQSEQWGWGYRWESVRAGVLKSWGRHDQSAAARALANGYLLKLEQAGLLTTEGRSNG